MLHNLLLVDDEPNILKALQRQLAVLDIPDYNVHVAHNTDEALELLKSQPIQVILSDQRMPHMTGIELLGKVKELYPNTIGMILSGYSDFNAVQDAINHGNVFRFLKKPWDMDELKNHIKDAFAKYDEQMQNLYAHQAMNLSLEGIMITDCYFKTLSVNTTFCLLTEYSQEEAIGVYIDLLDRTQITDEELGDMYELIKTQGIWQGNTYLKTKSGVPFPAFLSISTSKDHSGKLINYIYAFYQ